MARIRQHLHYSDTKGELAEYKDARHGAVEDALWDEDELIDYRPGSKKKRKPRKRGCPGNNYKGHVYVWQTKKISYRRWWDNKMASYEYEQYICCGCEQVKKMRWPRR